MSGVAGFSGGLHGKRVRTSCIGYRRFRYLGLTTFNKMLNALHMDGFLFTQVTMVHVVRSIVVTAKEPAKKMIIHFGVC